MTYLLCMNLKHFMKPEHLGVAVVITNQKRDLFYLQQKDEGCPIPEFRLTYCFFGGAIKSKEEDYDALKRELVEELAEYPSKMIIRNSKKLFDDYFLNIFKQKTRFSLYESILPDNVFKKISGFPVKEGKRKGFLVKKKDILKINFLPDLKDTLSKYLDFINNS